jgi:DNA-binding PadR family transcriptional regulator
MPRPTENVVAIFSTMLERPRRSWYGLELAKHTEIGSATIYAAMTRLERAGLLEATWEAIDPVELGRPRRRLYKLTGAGERVGRAMVANYKPRVRQHKDWAGWQPRPEERST